jgi:hypothetical protein
VAHHPPPFSYVPLLDEVQGSITALLKPLGFRKSGRTYNRTTSDGITQVINIQSGLVTSSLHGHFTINIGIHLPKISTAIGESQLRKFISEASCHIRYRISSLAKINFDKWWSLDDSIDTTIGDVLKIMKSFCIPLLDKLKDEGSVLEYCEDLQTVPGNTASNGQMYLAILFSSVGKKNEAEKYFDQAVHYVSNKRNSVYLSRLARIRDKCIPPAT